MASIGGMVHPLHPQADGGLYLQLGENGRSITAAIGPGLVAQIGIQHHELMQRETRLPVRFSPSVLALDGERELPVSARDDWEIGWSWDGPRVLDIEKVMDAAR
jgi:hypothetical protein